MTDDIPRRVRLDQLVPAELAIVEAVRKVEELPADVRLTKAVNLLQDARDQVADFVDKTPMCQKLLTRKSVADSIISGMDNMAIPGLKLESDSSLKDRIRQLEEALVTAAIPLETIILTRPNVSDSLWHGIIDGARACREAVSEVYSKIRHITK